MTSRHYRLILVLIALLVLAVGVSFRGAAPASIVKRSTRTPNHSAKTRATTTTPPTATPAPRLTVVPPPTTDPLALAVAEEKDAPAVPPIPFSWLLAYDSDVGGDDDIYLLPADGGQPFNLTHHPAEDRYPAWSPDGKKIAFQSNRDGNWEIYVLDLSGDALFEATLQISPSKQRQSSPPYGQLNRLTFNLAYDGAPAWSPDGAWIAFESYRDTAPCQLETPVPNPPPLRVKPQAKACPDLELYRVPATGGAPQRLTDSPHGDHQPAWSPDGDWIAFTSWRDGDKEVYVMPSTGGPARNVTTSAGDDWSPAWSPDGTALVLLSERQGTVELYRQSLDSGEATRLTTDGLPKERPSWTLDGGLIFARYDPGPAFEVYDPYRPGAHHLYRQPPEGGQLQSLWPETLVRHPALVPLADLAVFKADNALGQTPSTRGYGRSVGEARVPPAEPLPKLDLRWMDDVQAPDPRLVSGVDEAFRAWRAAVHARSGHDFLGRVSDIFRPARYYGHHLGYMSWHKAGRAVDLLFDWQDADGQNALYVVREDLAGQLYWRLFLKCAVQDGRMGEPLTQAPWYFWWHPDPAKEPETFANGGRRLPIPAGYFVDVTALAERYGWSRIAAYQLEDFHWQRDSTATEYWHYQHTDGLTWYQAMEQVYAPELLEELFARSVAATRGQTEEVMDGKGLPSADATKP